MNELFALLLAILLHEFGHLAFAKLFGIPCLSFGFRTGGAVLKFDFSQVGYFREGIVHAGGALFGIISSEIAWIVFGESAYYFIGISFALSTVNLLPIIGLDGGALLSCVLAQFLLPDTVWRIQKIVSLISVVFLWGAVLWIELRVSPNFSLIAFVLCVIFGSLK